MKYTFESNIEKIGSLPVKVDRQLIHEEPMLFGASIKFASENGGPLTRAFLNEAIESLLAMQVYCEANNIHIVIDTRSHILMPGFYPAIPGWHADAYPRAKYGEQPNLELGNRNNYHIVAFQSDQDDGVSRTLFSKHGTSTTMDVDNKHVWQSVHSQFKGETQSELDGEILKFSQATLHNAQAAHTKGWRWWIRVSCFYKPPENTVRRQVQVYAPIGLGW